MTTIPKKLTLAAERNAMTSLLTEAATSRGWKVDRFRDIDRCVTLVFKSDDLGVMMHLDPALGVPLLHWFGARHPLVYMPGAWQSVNPHHKRKATSYPEDLERMLAQMTWGIDAANDGSAFLPE